MTDLLNTKLSNRYEIHERIGAGGMARVFKAKDTNLDRWVAVKILHEHLSDDPSFSERFSREAKLVASLNHPNIVQVYDYNSFERDGIPVFYMVMPLISGDTLRVIMDRCGRQGIRLPQTQTLRIMHELCDALAYAHERGMAHRDIKPGNIIVDDAGRAILTDFGIARMIEGARFTQDSMTTGTPAYMAPEQANGSGGDARSDIYSLGVMFFEMWTGKLPFADESPASLILKHLYAPIPTIEQATGVPDSAMDAIMNSALAKNPEERFRTASGFALALRSIAGAATEPLPRPDSDAVSSGPQTTPIPARLPQNNPVAVSTGMMKAQRRSGNETTVFLRERFRTGFLAVGLVILALVAAIPFLQSVSPPAASSPTASIPPIDSLTAQNQQGFSATFSVTDPDRLKFPVNPEERGITRQLDDEAGTYRLTNTNYPSAATTIVNSEQPYGNITVTMVAKLEPGSAPDAGYGIIFRYQDDDNYNVFAVDGLGRYSIWVRQSGQWRELERQGSTERWQENANVLPIGSFNRLRINITQEALTLFINNQPITAPITENTFPYGFAGIYIAAPTTGIADVTVDLFEVYPIIPSMTEPGRMG